MGWAVCDSMETVLFQKSLKAVGQKTAEKGQFGKSYISADGDSKDCVFPCHTSDDLF